MQSQTDKHNIFNYTDSELDLHAPEKYAIDICISANRLSYTIHSSNRVMGLRYINASHDLLNGQIGAYVQQMEWYNNRYRQTRVFIDHDMCTLVPEALFESDKAPVYLEMLHKLHAGQKVLSVKQSGEQAVSVFGINAGLYQEINNLFDSPLILHQSSVLLKVAASFNNADLKNHLLVQVEQGFIGVIHYLNGALRFMNTFRVEADTDMVYFVLSVLELLKIPADKSGIYLLGDISTSSSGFGLLKKYIPDVSTVNRLENIQYPMSFREFQEQQHYLALHTLLCE